MNSGMVLHGSPDYHSSINVAAARRSVGSPRPLQGLQNDLRDAWRGWRRDKAFACVSAAILAVALGGNTALFMFLNAFFLRPLPIASPDRHVEIEACDGVGATRRSWPLDDLSSVREAARAVLDLTYAVAELRVAIASTAGSPPVAGYAEAVSPEYFALARPRASRGRLFDARDGHAGEPGVAILLSDAGWRRLTLSDPLIAGRTIVVNGVATTVVGVVEPSFTGLEPIVPDFWILPSGAAALTAGKRVPPQAYRLAGVLRPGVTPEQAGGALTGPLAAAMKAGTAQVGSAGSWRVAARRRPTLFREREEAAPIAWALLAAFGLVGLVACANLASMHLARGVARSRETAVRLALGAPRLRLVRQLVVESVALALVGAAAGAAFTAVVVAAIQRHVFGMVLSSGLTMVAVAVDWRAFAYSGVLALLFGVACGLLPALQVTSPTLNHLASALTAGNRAASARGHGRLGTLLVVGQVACSVALLAGAGFLLRGAAAVDRTPIGYDVDRLVDVAFPQPTSELVRRTRETGIRLALGATPRQVVTEVLVGAARTVGTGLAIGLPICLAVSLAGASTLTMVDLLDPAVYVATTLALLGAGLLAALLPARRAAATDPIVALRHD